MDEKQLIKGCINGDRKAQKVLYDKYSRKMMGVCLRYVKDTEDARDLMQEGFIKLFTNLGTYTGNGSFDGWVRKIFVNCALERLRHHDILRDAGDIDDANCAEIPDETFVSKISSDELMSYVKSLPDGYRMVFNMFAIEGYSHKEISEKLHILESTSRSQYARARKLLQKMILNN
ncbi:MAG: sigma-70 family RNA polymerase sigma factor [Tannerella sp.]|jgi:RNA polymerase sigma-70 factor (ECF subfamily)|nr:sigma-70 family RNA polymerase sigma factor [Tannerella sp.]